MPNAHLLVYHILVASGSSVLSQRQAVVRCPVSFIRCPSPPPSLPLSSPPSRGVAPNTTTTTTYIPTHTITHTHTMSSEVAYLQSLRSVRERCSKVFSLAEQDKLEYWDVDLSKESDIVEFTCGLIEVGGW